MRQEELFMAKRKPSVSVSAWGELICRGARMARLVAPPAGLSLGLMACAHDGSVQQTVDREVLRHGMPREFGENANVTLEEVTYPPNGSTRPHRHSCPVVAYVVEGSIRMQLKGGAERIYQAGEAFYEDPTDIHLVSANGSSKVAAKFVAFSVCRDGSPLTEPVAPPAGSPPNEP
jgi:quercetin dioxygenase-like cupin family protein